MSKSDKKAKDAYVKEREPKMSKSEIKLKERCKVLEELVTSIYSVYNESNKDQKRFIETIVGAAIWYLPHTEIKYWTGKISEEALYKLQQDSKTKLTKEHQFPRKIAAKKILTYYGKNEKWIRPFIELYENEFALFNYVTPEENKKLVKFQTEGQFESIEKSYENAKIKLQKIELEDFKNFKKSKKR